MDNQATTQTPSSRKSSTLPLFLSLTFLLFLFRLCSSVLQDYVDKESRLLDLKTEKLQLAQGGNQGRGSNASAQLKNAAADGDSAIEEAKMGQKVVRQPVGDISAIEMNEGILVQQVQSLTPIIQKQILNNF